MTISSIDESNVALIRRLALAVWPEAYRPILPEEQIQFMLEDMYSVVSLRQQIEQGAQFIVAWLDRVPVGFASYTPEELSVRIHKLYVLTAYQKKGVGQALLNFIESEAKGIHAHRIELNVNRRNPALNFYIAAGFAIRESTDIPYHNWVLDDYVMEKRLAQTGPVISGST